MAESWRQKQVDIEHWLQGIQAPDRELTSSSDILTTDQTTISSPIVTPFSSPPNNTELLFSPRPQPTPVNESLAFISIQSKLTVSPPAMSDPIGSTNSPSYDTVSKGNSPEFGYTRSRKTQSPLPMATPEQKLPSFGTFDEDDDPSQDVDIKRVNKWINRPPSNPMRYFGRASTSPVLLHKDHNPIKRKESAPIAFFRGTAVPRSNLAQTLTVATLSRKKSLSEQDVSQLVEKEKERRTSKGGYSSDSEVKTNNPEPLNDDSSDLQSSTGACGLGSDLSSSDGGCVSDKSAVLRRARLANGMLLSAESVDVIETRLRERRLGLGPTGGRNDDACTSPALLLSPTSPPPHLSRQSRLSRSPTPTPPTSPYHLSIVPLTVHSGTPPYTKATRVTRENELGISKKQLTQFNMSQQFSFDTTNDEDFNKPARHPKFLKSSFLTGTSLSSLGMATHHRSHSDMSLIKSQSNSRHGSLRHDTTNIYSADRRYKSQLDLSSSKVHSEVDGSKPLTIYEQVQLKKLQTEGKEGRTSGSLKKTKVFRQDSGLGTLSTIS